MFKSITINNFKCFKDFEAGGFTDVNLIGGKNNVGKTAFMEACFVGLIADDVKSFASVMSEIKFRRESVNLFEKVIQNAQSVDNKLLVSFFELFSGIDISIDNKKIKFDIDEKDGIKEYIFQIDKKNIKVDANRFHLVDVDVDVKNIGFIDNFGLSKSDIISDFSAIQKKDEEIYLDKVISNFDNNITKFKIIEDTPQCKMDSRYYELTEFGDGLRTIISVVIKMFVCENGYLLVDEIDNGIHHTQFDSLWCMIFELSQKLNVQVFAITHSKECIESFYRIAKKTDKIDISFIELGRDKDSNLKAIVYDKDWFIDEMEQSHEVRGW